MLELTPERARVFRITHIANMPWILQNGLTSKTSELQDPNFVQIGNPDLIEKRSSRSIPIPPGGTLDDYIPFYFTPFSPMLYNIKTGWNGITQRPMREIVLLVSSLHSLVEQGVRFVLSDRHAYLKFAQYSNSPENLDMIDWEILQTRNFVRDPNDPAKFERYQAEALIHRQLPVEGLNGVVCHGPEEEAQLRETVQNSGAQVHVVARPHWFF